MRAAELNLPFMDRESKGRWQDLMPLLADNSINMGFLSPPYALQRTYDEGDEPDRDRDKKDDDKVDLITPEQYPDYLVDFMLQFWSKMEEGGSAFIDLNSFVETGDWNPYVWESILAVLKKTPWKMPFKPIIRFKPDGKLGSKTRPADTYSYVYWFSKGEPTNKNLVACGRHSDRIGFVGPSRYGQELVHGHSDGFQSGISKIGSVLRCPNAHNDKKIMHPAQFPTVLPGYFIKTFSKRGDVIFDPFGGSGNTGLAAQALWRHFILFDARQKFVNIANDRLENDPRYTPGNPWLPKAIRRLIKRQSILDFIRDDEVLV
jgi:DNA modification methylase